ncbi:pentapeptide repeat-containing protein [Synechocystis sp. LKSZ1]|uniref:pentapeptide repeat-containing protein n=1 Tax=Synechocystis sp. LKSZ1 TaxID=3144951 RepID=UPI00336BFE69
MVQSSTSQEIQAQYQAGQRNFQNLQLRRVDLHGLDLSGADFSGTDFTEANLRDTNLSGANFTEAYCNGADFSGANLTQANLTKASLIKTYLIKANLQQSNLENALCTGAYLTRANLQEACLNGTFLNGANLTGANFSQAKYNGKTGFDPNFNPEKAGLKKVAQGLTTAPTVSASQASTAIVTPALPTDLTVEELLLTLNHLSALGNHYLGNTMARRYWQSAQPKTEWFEQFYLDPATDKITTKGPKKQALTQEQIQLAQTWAQKYVKACTLIFKDFPKLIEPDQLAFPVV